MIVADGNTLRRLIERRTAEFLPPGLPRQDVLVEWDRLKPQPEPPKPERGLDTAPTAGMAFTRFQHEVLAEVIAEIRAEVRRDLERATQR